MSIKANVNRCLISVMAVLLVVACWWPSTNRVAEEEVKAGLKRALVTFASARTLGAFISATQGTQISMQPGGVGVTLALGQMLQPLDQLVDQFDDVMLVASVSLGIQLVLLKMGGHMLVCAAVSILLILALFGWWRGRYTFGRWIGPALAVLLFVRFAVPVSALASEGLYQAFMKDQYRQETAVIERVATSEAAATIAAEEESRFVRAIKGFADKLTTANTAATRLKDAAAGAVESIVRLIALFLLQTVALPIGFLWITWRLARGLGRVASPTTLTQSPR